MASEDNPPESELEPTEIVPQERTIAGKYRLERLVGEGGMGSVYEAVHTGLGKKVAIKILSETFAGDSVFVKRFRREARAAAAVQHENVVAVTDTGEDEEGIPFLVMELLDGEGLSSVLRRERALTPGIASDVAIQVLKGLGAAHEQGVIHRDLKPANIFLARRGDGTQRVKILDFGISKFGGDLTNVTAEGAVIGTPSYMSPEQVRGQEGIDTRSDLYAVGVMLYRMVTGRLPFVGKKSRDIYKRILKGNATPPSELRDGLPRALERVIQKAMALSADDRYQTAEDFLTALRDAVPPTETTSGLRILSRSSLPPLLVSDTGDTDVGTAPTMRGRQLPKAPRSARKSRGAPERSNTSAELAVPVSRTKRAAAAGAVAAVVVAAAIWGFWPAGTGEGSIASNEIDEPTADDEALFPPDGPPLLYGVTRYTSVEEVRRTHEPLARFLETSLHRPVELVVAEDYELEEKILNGDVHLGALSAYRFVSAKDQEPALRLLATGVNPGGSSYQGLILVRANSGIDALVGLSGKVFCYVSPSSSSGYLYPRALFRREGMDPDEMFRATRFTGDHLSALYALRDGACDGAAVYQSILADSDLHGMPIQTFHQLASTERIPYDAYCVPPSVSDADADRLEELLLSLVPGGDLATRVLGGDANLRGFTRATDADYDGVRSMAVYVDTKLDE